MRICLCTLLLLAFAAQGTSAAEPSGGQRSVQKLQDIAFAEPNGTRLLLDLYMPTAIDNPPLVMFIHGGGWKNGDRTRCKLSWVADDGYAVASIEYRLSDEATFPAQIHDCKGALRWLRAHQDEYGYDADRVVVAGTSAGGHLAALMGTSGGVDELEGSTAGHSNQSSRVQGVINYYGPTDFLLRSRNQPSKTDDPAGSVYRLLGGAVRDHRSLARLASPAEHVGPGDPPLLLLHGELDKTVFLSQPRRLERRYRENELDVHLHIETGRGHGWPEPSGEERRLVLRFLEEQLRQER